VAYDFLDMEYQDAVATVILNRPEKRNALSRAMRAEIVVCLKELEANDEVRVVILTGRGTAFCAGFDLSELSEEGMKFEAVDELDLEYHSAVANFAKPLIAAVNGPAFAGGFDLASLCDIRIAAETAVFAHPEIKSGAPALYGPLKEIIGGAQARDICLSGRRVDAAEACRIGLVSRVVAEDSLMEEARQLARSISEAPLDTLKRVKRQITELSNWQSL
jgi:enoyl-CoA hydratase